MGKSLQYTYTYTYVQRTVCVLQYVLLLISIYCILYTVCAQRSFVFVKMMVIKSSFPSHDDMTSSTWDVASARNFLCQLWKMN